jgi:hypothetical protein
VGDVPVVDFLELLYLSRTDSDNLELKMEEYYQKHPDYFLIQSFHFDTTADEKEKNNAIERLENLFSEHKHHITEFEVSYFLLLYSFYLFSADEPLSVIVAFVQYAKSVDFISRQYIDKIATFLSFAKMIRIYQSMNEA